MIHLASESRCTPADPNRVRIEVGTAATTLIMALITLPRPSAPQAAQLLPGRPQRAPHWPPHSRCERLPAWPPRCRAAA